MHRRFFAQLIGSALFAPLWGCRSQEPDLPAISRMLGLQPSELIWLQSLAPDQQRELRSALEQPAGERTDRAVALAFSLLGTRSRTFAFVGYPTVNDRRSGCDGLLAE
jgi:hypothetical protein